MAHAPVDDPMVTLMDGANLSQCVKKIKEFTQKKNVKRGYEVGREVRWDPSRNWGGGEE